MEKARRVRREPPGVRNTRRITLTERLDNHIAVRRSLGYEHLTGRIDCLMAQKDLGKRRGNAPTSGS